MTSQQGIKKRGIRQLSFHDLRLSHCPSNKTTTRSPRRYVTYIYTTTWQCNNMHPHVGMFITHP